MIRRPPQSTQSRSSAASDVYKRQGSTSPLEPATPLHAHTAATPPPTKTKSPTSTSLQSHKTVTLKQQLQQPNSRSSRGSVVSAAADDRSGEFTNNGDCLLYTSPSPRDRTRSRMPSSA
eukprot:TRINITY_DN22962_c0_g1_i1.p2 TRINITY_DN22962_c0_g1~~TRINITY_DN22962_c0_g1_i1.p2  ORF type:complete len:119 (+),score=32.23 TRINITY_DN22962_c0_g1_i1:9-365(+)